MDRMQDEIQKIWERIIEIEGAISKEIPDYEKELIDVAKYAKINLDEIKQVLEEIEPVKINFQNVKEYLAGLQKEIDQIKTKLVNDTTEINEHSVLLTVKLDEAEDKHKEILSLSQQCQELEKIIKVVADKLSEIETNATQTKELHAKSEVAHKNIVKRKDEIEEIYFEIFGYDEMSEDGSTKTHIDGLKDELESSYSVLNDKVASLDSTTISKYEELRKQFVDYQKDTDDRVNEFFELWNNNLSILNDEIKKLLPLALTAGLSSAYEKKRKQEEEEADAHQKMFRNAIIAMCTFALIPVGMSIYSFYNHKTIDEIIRNLPSMVSAVIPLYIPVLWIGYFANKRINLSKRLIEEYSHKEALSKTYEGLTRQIDGIEDTGVKSELQIKLLFNLLEVSAENPGKLITDYSKADHPLMDALEKSAKLADAVERLSKLPGFNKIAEKLAKKSEALLAQQKEKSEKGIELS